RASRRPRPRRSYPARRRPAAPGRSGRPVARDGPGTPRSASWEGSWADSSGGGSEGAEVGPDLAQPVLAGPDVGEVALDALPERGQVGGLPLVAGDHRLD